MKHFCVLMTLVLGHVLALSTDSFKQHVNRTNCMLKQLNSDQLANIITYYIMDPMDIEAVTSLLAAPTSIFNDGGWNYPAGLRDNEENIVVRMNYYGKEPGELDTNVEQLKLYEMGIERRNRLKESVLRLLQSVEGYIQTAAFNVQQRCRLVALYVNVEQPDKHIFYSSAFDFIGNENNCRLKYNKSDERELVYRMWDDGYYYLVYDINERGTKLTPILEQVQPCCCTIC
ncbi:uncharacterized protein LOC126836376 isoform X1 [Adelges cooleyi]|uniref:uncharacterized protein LOC126836376 isoform X1 n=1 Tax=Adelges cooleyi TaxID=133065 RepID=UPI00217F2D81|nr:uncharacterized protein LOC126836376 isoform X1 [Adelges cooleyi]